MSDNLKEELVKFTLKLPVPLDTEVKKKAKELGLSKLSYIRMVLSKEVNK